MKMELKMDMESLHGKTVMFIKDIFSKIKLKDLEKWFFMMESNMKVIGKTIKWMEKAFLFGLMEEDIGDNLPMIKRMDLELCNGVMEEFIRDNLKMEYSMEKVNTNIEMGKSLKVNGKRVE